MLDRLIEKNFDLHDKLLEIEALAKELSQREEELKQLSSKQKLFYQALTSTADGVVITNSEGKIIAVNPSFCRITGYCEAESLEMDLKDIKRITTLISALTRSGNTQTKQATGVVSLSREEKW
ncbi:PAS domain-containing protein [Pseudoalteromonas sp. Hal099]